MTRKTSDPEASKRPYSVPDGYETSPTEECAILQDRRRRKSPKQIFRENFRRLRWLRAASPMVATMTRARFYEIAAIMDSSIDSERRPKIDRVYEWFFGSRSADELKESAARRRTYGRDAAHVVLLRRIERIIRLPAFLFPKGGWHAEKETPDANSETWEGADYGVLPDDGGHLAAYLRFAVTGEATEALVNDMAMSALSCGFSPTNSLWASRIVRQEIREGYDWPETRRAKEFLVSDKRWRETYSEPHSWLLAETRGWIEYSVAVAAPALDPGPSEHEKARKQRLYRSQGSIKQGAVADYLLYLDSKKDESRSAPDPTNLGDPLLEMEKATKGKPITTRTSALLESEIIAPVYRVQKWALGEEKTRSLRAHLFARQCAKDRQPTLRFSPTQQKLKKADRLFTAGIAYAIQYCRLQGKTKEWETVSFPRGLVSKWANARVGWLEAVKADTLRWLEANNLTAEVIRYSGDRYGAIEDQEREAWRGISPSIANSGQNWLERHEREQAAREHYQRKGASNSDDDP